MIRVLIVLFTAFVLYRLQEIVYRRRWDSRVKFEMAYGVSEVFEGGTVGFRETIWNGKRLPMPYVRASYVHSAHLRQTDLAGNFMHHGRFRDTFFVVPGKRRISRNTLLICEKRGYYVIDKATVYSSDIFLSRTYKKVVDLDIALTVYPGEIEISEADIPYKSLSGEILTKRFILPDPFEFIGIREYQPFDSLKQLNFKAWAKTGQPMSNIHGHTVSQEVRIVLNLQPYCPFLRDALFENAIRLAAFLARKYLEEGIPVSFATNGLDCVTNQPSHTQKGQTSRHLREIYEILARIDLDKNVHSAPILESLPTAAELGGGVLALISSYTDSRLEAWHKEALAQNAKILWIAPRVPHDKVAYADGVVVWEESP